MLLETQLAPVDHMAQANDLPDAIITESGLKTTPLDVVVPYTAQVLIDQTANDPAARQDHRTAARSP